MQSEEFLERLENLDVPKGREAIHSLLTAAEDEHPDLIENLDIARKYLERRHEKKRRQDKHMNVVNVRNLDYLAELEKKFYGSVMNNTANLLHEYDEFEEIYVDVDSH